MGTALLPIVFLIAVVHLAAVNATVDEDADGAILAPGAVGRLVVDQTRIPNARVFVHSILIAVVLQLLVRVVTIFLSVHVLEVSVLIQVSLEFVRIVIDARVDKLGQIGKLIY